VLAGNFTVKTGDDDDTLDIAGVTASGKIVVKHGDGSDTIVQ
jgi:hypothetical protein